MNRTVEGVRMIDDYINKIICGDCLEVMKGMPDKCVDLIVTDPPYGIDLEYDIYKDSEYEWYKLMMSSIPEMIRVSKMVIMPSTKIHKLEWFYKHYPPDWLICWYKGSTGHASYIGFNDWEPHLVYGRTKNNLFMHDYFQTTSSPKLGTYGHPCPKPIEWAHWLIAKASEKGNIILDPFSGSGTVCVAAKELYRNFIGIELSPKYCKIAEDRLKQEVLGI